MEEGPEPQKPKFNIEEAKWALLPESDDEAKDWLAEVDGLLYQMIAKKALKCRWYQWKQMALRSRREIVLTIRVPIPATHITLAAVMPEPFHLRPKRPSRTQTRVRSTADEAIYGGSSGKKNIFFSI
ncbi:hypothetical protein LOAG_14436, partial [Loa loa]